MPGEVIVLYGLKTCDTCRKAKRELEAAGNTVKFVDIGEDADLPARLPGWLKAAPDKLVNKSSATRRALTNAEKTKAGSTVRFDWKSKRHDKLGLFLNSNTSLISDFLAN